MEILAVFTPLLGFLLAFLFGKQMGDRGAQFVTCAGMSVAAFVSVVLFCDVVLDSDPRTITLATWMTAGDFSVDWALRVDQLTAVMICVVNVVSACVHFYSIGYMSHDVCKARFMSYLSLFTFAMLMLVTADNLLQLFFGWEGVGVASYLLIGFWNHKHSANTAAVKAFIVNRVGDFGLALGVMTAFVIFGSVQFDAMFEMAPEIADVNFIFLGYSVHALTLVCLLLFIGACGKSAQLGLHTWLPDAMEGPTPVSALIHAATMVTAGVFLVARMSPVFEYAPFALEVVTVVGAATALVAATIGLTQFDIKRVIAYSTMSQLGYMFFALGVSAYGAAIFHLMTHAFFKALLFLGAGSVIHAMSDEQDMRNMGGIWKLIPTTYVLMWIGSLALAGIPFFAGYYSKDIILESAFAAHSNVGIFAYWMGIAAALMTAFYSWRLIFMTFHGAPRADEHVMAHVHESPPIMISPLIILATGAIFAGAFFYGPFVSDGQAGHGAEQIVSHEDEAKHDVETVVSEVEHGQDVWNRSGFWGHSLKVLPENDSIAKAHGVPEWVKLLPTFMGALGIFMAWVVYIKRAGVAARIAAIAGPVHRLFFRKWYFDELYDAVFVRNAWRIGRVFSVKGDKQIIDGCGPDGIAAWSQRVAGNIGRLQTGYLYHYAFAMMAGLFGLVTWFFLRAGF